MAQRRDGSYEESVSGTDSTTIIDKNTLGVIIFYYITLNGTQEEGSNQDRREINLVQQRIPLVHKYDGDEVICAT